VIQAGNAIQKVLLELGFISLSFLTPLYDLFCQQTFKTFISNDYLSNFSLAVNPLFFASCFFIFVY